MSLFDEDTPHDEGDYEFDEDTPHDEGDCVISERHMVSL